MRNKRAGAGLPGVSSIPSGGPQFRNSSKSEEESSSDTQTQTSNGSTSFPSSSLNFSSKRAADMLATYGNPNLEFGSGSGESSSGGSASAKNTTTGSVVLSEIREGAERLANELDEYLARSSEKSFIRDKDAPPLSDEAVADLQLATARKLREVSCVNLPVIMAFENCMYIVFLGHTVDQSNAQVDVTLTKGN
jgi:hypothetical protein